MPLIKLCKKCAPVGSATLAEAVQGLQDLEVAEEAYLEDIGEAAFQVIQAEEDRDLQSMWNGNHCQIGCHTEDYGSMRYFTVK